MIALAKKYYEAKKHLKDLLKSFKEAEKCYSEQQNIVAKIQQELSQTVGNNIRIKNFIVEGWLIRVELKHDKGNAYTEVTMEVIE